jgi:hypothetical protein
MLLCSLPQTTTIDDKLATQIHWNESEDVQGTFGVTLTEYGTC